MDANKKIVILGGGSAGWMSAAMLSNYVPKNIEITLVESEEIGIIGVGEATIPPIMGFNQLLGLDEKVFVRETKASFKLGIEFVNWNKIGDRYIHPFGEYGAELGATYFHHFLMRANGNLDSISDYSMSIAAAKKGKFAIPNYAPNNPMSEIKYAYHFDASLYAKFLRTYAEARGVKRIEGKVQRVSQNAQSGNIETLSLENGQEVEGDFFIDCTGFRGVLIEETLKAGYEDWSNLLPCDCAIAVPSEKEAEITPYTRATAHEFGWQWRIPLQHRTGNGIVFSTQFADIETATQKLIENLTAKPIDAPRVVRFKTGIRKKAWVKNCVAIGLSCGFLEPLESTAIHLIQNGILKLLNCLPFPNLSDEIIDEYNNSVRAQYEDVRDFLVLHYKATNRNDSEFWNYNRLNPISDRLNARIEMFRQSGRLFIKNHELFKEASWLAVLVGQGISAQSYDPIAAKLPQADLIKSLDFIKMAFADTANKMPLQHEFIENFIRTT